MAGVNPLRGEATLKAGDVEKKLAINVNVFCELEADTGLDVDGVLGGVMNNPSFTLLRKIFCAALQTHQPGTTLAETGDLMSDAGLEAITAVLQSLFKAIMPEAKDGGANPPKPARGRAGAG